MTARIYMPARTAMQSGFANTKDWVLDFEPEEPQAIEPLMGWTSSGDMRQQVHLDFPPRRRRSLIASAMALLISCSKPSSPRDEGFPIPTISPSGAATPGPTEIAPTSALLRGFEFVMREDRKCANVCWG